MQQRLEEVRSEKEQLHDNLIAAEIKIDRLQSGTVAAMQTKFGEKEEANTDQPCPQEENTPNLGSSTPPVSDYRFSFGCSSPFFFFSACSSKWT